MNRENLQLLKDAFNLIEEAKSNVQSVYDEIRGSEERKGGADDLLEELNDVIDSLDEANNVVWVHISDFVHYPENYQEEA